MKKMIPLQDAAGIMVQAVFKQADKNWDQLWEPLIKLSHAVELEPGEKEYVKFNFSIAALALNMRSAFDVYGQHLGGKLFDSTLNLLQHFFGRGKPFAAVQAALLKYIEAFNTGILALKDPIRNVSMLLYYKIGLRNTEQQVVDERFFAPEPQLVEYINNSLTLFAGKWEAFEQRYELGTPGGPSQDN